MKDLEFNEMEIINAGDLETCIYASGTLMTMGIASMFTPAGAALVLGGALLGFVCSETMQ